MSRLINQQSDLSADQSPSAIKHRTYQEIAEILTEREGKTITTERVRQICGAAERKIARALVADPEFQETQFGASCLSRQLFTKAWW